MLLQRVNVCVNTWKSKCEIPLAGPTTDPGVVEGSGSISVLSLIKDLTPYHLCSLGPPGDVKGQKLSEVPDKNLQISGRLRM